MNNNTHFIHYQLDDPQTLTIRCIGVWTFQHVQAIQDAIQKYPKGSFKQVNISGEEMTTIDSVGAWLLVALRTSVTERTKQLAMNGFSEQAMHLLKLVAPYEPSIKAFSVSTKQTTWLERMGRATVQKIFQCVTFITFMGEFFVRLFACLREPKRLIWRSLVDEIDLNGWRALPILALLSFLIGVVLTYQLGLQLKDYGANIYIVNVTGMAILREFGPLLTAIIVAGRTGSSYTAQIGMMKVNQEIDALLTMGISPMERLMLPKLLGLIIAMPLLMVWSDVFGMLGSMVMAENILEISYQDFLNRFPEAVPLKHYFIGLSKAPVFALLIAMVGCFQGMQVSASAESVGWQTTKSVVQALFLIIIADAVFSVIYSWLEL